MTADLTQLTRTALIKEMEQLRDAVREIVEPLAEGDLWRSPSNRATRWGT